MIKLKRLEPKTSNYTAIRSAIEGGAALTLLTLIGYLSDLALIMAPFGASCVLIYSQPASHLSQPINVILGYAAGSLVGILAFNLLPFEWWFIGIPVGFTIYIMSKFRITHAPAGAMPVIIYLEKINEVSFYLYSILPGSLILVGLAYIVHRIPPKTQYPSLK